jgi:hypothetical protein
VKHFLKNFILGAALCLAMGFLATAIVHFLFEAEVMWMVLILFTLIFGLLFGVGGFFGDDLD